MAYQIKDESGDWIDGEPTQSGQPYRFISGGGGICESYWGSNADARVAYTISEQQITANGQPVQLFAGNYYCQPGDTVQLIGSITDSEDGTVTSIGVPMTLKMPLVRHANGQPTNDEIYLNVTLQNGVITAVGKIEKSGDWKILIERNNEALKRIGADWKLSAADITFLA